MFVQRNFGAFNFDDVSRSHATDVGGGDLLGPLPELRRKHSTLRPEPFIRLSAVNYTTNAIRYKIMQQPKEQIERFSNEKEKCTKLVLF